MLAKRIFDVLLSMLGLSILIPVFLIISCIILMDSSGGVFYKQMRIGRNKKPFNLLKFRTMRLNSDKASLLTIGDHDSRITRIGHYLRKYKLDELPQLFNILKGDMSFVGPRPEVSKYVALYDEMQLRVLTVKPGLTDWASIDYIDESQVLANVKNPESFYIENIIPAKITHNLRYIDHNNLWIDVKIIALTIKRIIFRFLNINK